MLKEIKARNAAAVIIKEQSCIGRDIIEAGLLKRVFGTYHVRFIAADILDVANRFDSVLTLRDRISGRHTAGTSRKIKAVFKLNMKKGLRCAGASAMAALHPKRTRASG